MDFSLHFTPQAPTHAGVFPRYHGLAMALYNKLKHSHLKKSITAVFPLGLLFLSL